MYVVFPRHKHSFRSEYGCIPSFIVGLFDRWLIVDELPFICFSMINDSLGSLDRFGKEGHLNAESVSLYTSVLNTFRPI